MIDDMQNKLEECKNENRRITGTGYKLIIFWFVIGFILGALIY